MSLLKVPFLLPQTAGMHKLMTPPHLSSADERLKPANWGEWILYVTWPPIVIKSILWAAGLTEALVIAARHHPASPIAKRILSTLVIRGTPANIRVTPLFAVGCLLITAGGIIRVQAFRTLGSLFTFELSVRKGHQLITSGPYAYVRHPSYTGLFLAYAGELFCHASAGSWLRESGILSTWLGKGVVACWVGTAVSIVCSLTLRMSKEEEVLRKEFGKEWDDWAQRVRYRLVPGVY